jgi:hypothetical protein
LVVAPTVMALGVLAGDWVHASAPRLLPAATTTVTPAAVRSAAASLSAAEREPPRDSDATAFFMPLLRT